MTQGQSHGTVSVKEYVLPPSGTFPLAFVDALHFSNVGMICTWTTAGSPTGTLKIQLSNDATNWIDSFTTADLAIDPNLNFTYMGFPYAYFRLHLDITGGTGGDVLTYSWVKKN